MPFKSFILLLCCVFAVASVSCKKKKKDVPDPNPPAGQEADLTATIPNIYLNETRNAAQGATLGIKVNITSNPAPPEGVTITVTALDPALQPIAQNAPFDSKAASIDVTLINLPNQKVAQIVVKVASKTKPSNFIEFKFGVMNKTPA
ncbi:hypothetical protein ACWKWU_17340 [Chitinophaga lutea]